MKNVLEIEEDHQYVAKEGSDRKRCFYCIESIVGKPDYKAKNKNLLNVNGFVENAAEVFVKII